MASRHWALWTLILALAGCSGGGGHGGSGTTFAPSRTAPGRAAPSHPPASRTGTGSPATPAAPSSGSTPSSSRSGTGSSVAPLTSRLYLPDSALIQTTDVPAGATATIERLFPGLAFKRPSYITGAGDGSGRLFVCELKGVVTALAPLAATASPLTTAPTPSVFLDISNHVNYGTEEGLFSIAFHPKFATNGQVFALYSTGTSYTNGAPDQVRVRLARFTLAAGSTTALDPASEVVLLEVPKAYHNHNGGQVSFGPDGFLYVSFGDGGCCGDPERNAQNLGSVKGKILRLDVDSGSPYASPSDNPFVATAGARPEIWAYGLRNPWRFSFDRKTGDLWAGDVGQDMWEEVDVIQKGGNYGWSAYEGDNVYDGAIAAPGSIPPVIEYDHDSGHCVIGGYVYRGARVPALQGAYLYADYFSGSVWAARWDGVQVTSNIPISNTTAPSICSFGQDDAGEVYLLSYSTGAVYRVAPVVSRPAFPQTLSATGLFKDLPSQTLRAEAIPYCVTEPLWSDHALKARAMLLPHTDTVQWTQVDGWGMPADTIMVKSFWLERTRGDPKTKQIVETRLLVQNQGDWHGYSYEWNDQGTDANLLSDSKAKTYTIQANGQSVAQDWYFPSRADCLSCHTTAAGFVLGPQTPQLNSDFDYSALGGPIENQLVALSGFGVFSQPLPGPPSSLPKLSAHADPNATLDARARSYLHVNCAHCHRPGGGAPVNLDLRFDTPLASMNLVGVAPESGDLGATGASLVTKGNPDLSILYLRLANLGSNHMPPLATSVVDDDGVALIKEWIERLP